MDQSADEFAVPTLLRDSTNNYRGGIRFEYNRFHITLEQGGTTFKDDDSASDAIQTLGDNTSPLLGQTLSLTGLNQAYGIRGTSSYSTALATFHITSNMDFSGQFLYSEPKTTVNFGEVSSGNLAQISSLLFYSNQLTIGTGAANQPHTTGQVGYELRLFRNHLRFLYSLMTDHYHDTASPFVIQYFITAPANPSIASLTTALNYGQAVNYNQQDFNLIYDLGSKITLRGGARVVSGVMLPSQWPVSLAARPATWSPENSTGLSGLAASPTTPLRSSTSTWITKAILPATTSISEAA